jgi:hypothetical protein
MVQNKTGWSARRHAQQVSILVNTLGKDGSMIYVGRMWCITSLRHG